MRCVTTGTVEIWSGQRWSLRAFPTATNQQDCHSPSPILPRQNTKSTGGSVGEVPTVQELLRYASREVRSIMWEVTALDGSGLAAPWPAFAAHARDALSAVPVPDAATRLLIHRAAGPRYRPNRWGPPVDAQADLRLVRAGQSLATVADLLTRHAAPPTSMAAHREADLVRRDIAECLLVGSHATALGLREHATRLRPARPGIAFEQPGVRLAVKGAALAQSCRLASDLDTFDSLLAHSQALQFGGDRLGNG